MDTALQTVSQNKKIATSFWIPKEMTVTHSSESNPSQHARTIVQEVNTIPFHATYPYKMLVIAVRSFGIIGGGAVLFGASAIVGQTILGILPALGEVQQFVFGIILKLF